MAKIEANSIRTGERGQYETTKPEETTKKRFETMAKSEDECNEFNADSEGSIEIDDCLIHQDVFELYALFTRGRVPDYMSAPIVENQDFGSKIKHESKFVKN